MFFPQRNAFSRRLISVVSLASFLCMSVWPTAYVQAQGLDALPRPGVMVPLSAPCQPASLKGLRIFPDNPFRLDFILDKGTAANTSINLKNESARLIRYFLAALTVPDTDIWVNLSPYEKDRIAPRNFSQTEMGQDLLAQDYWLKQVAASLLYPEGETGKKFWQKIYAQAYEKYGITELPVDTFNKVWIVPEKAEVFENGDRAYVITSRLRVLLEQDYFALKNETATGLMADDLFTRDTRKSAQDIMRDIVLPELERDVNEGANFALLRQVYNSVILAAWFKQKIKNSLLDQKYTDQSKIQGIHVGDTRRKEKIYARYLEAFKKGVYNLVKEETLADGNVLVPKKYFSGGIQIALGAQSFSINYDKSMLAMMAPQNSLLVRADLVMQSVPEGSKVQISLDDFLRLGARRGNTQSADYLTQTNVQYMDLLADRLRFSGMGSADGKLDSRAAGKVAAEMMRIPYLQAAAQEVFVKLYEAVLQLEPETDLSRYGDVGQDLFDFIMTPEQKQELLHNNWMDIVRERMRWLMTAMASHPQSRERALGILFDTSTYGVMTPALSADGSRLSEKLLEFEDVQDGARLTQQSSLITQDFTKRFDQNKRSVFLSELALRLLYLAEGAQEAPLSARDALIALLKLAETEEDLQIFNRSVVETEFENIYRNEFLRTDLIRLGHALPNDEDRRFLTRGYVWSLVSAGQIQAVLDFIDDPFIAIDAEVVGYIVSVIEVLTKEDIGNEDLMRNLEDKINSLAKYEGQGAVQQVELWGRLGQQYETLGNKEQASNAYLAAWTAGAGVANAAFIRSKYIPVWARKEIEPDGTTSSQSRAVSSLGEMTDEGKVSLALDLWSLNKYEEAKTIFATISDRDEIAGKYFFAVRKILGISFSSMDQKAIAKAQDLISVGAFANPEPDIEKRMKQESVHAVANAIKILVDRGKYQEAFTLPQWAYNNGYILEEGKVFLYEAVYLHHIKHVLDSDETQSDFVLPYFITSIEGLDSLGDAEFILALMLKYPALDKDGSLLLLVVNVLREKEIYGKLFSIQDTPQFFDLLRQLIMAGAISAGKNLEAVEGLLTDQSAQEVVPDQAQAANYGGVDLALSQKNLTVQHEGNAVVWQFSPEMKQRLNRMTGIAPVVVGMQNIGNTIEYLTSGLGG